MQNITTNFVDYLFDKTTGISDSIKQKAELCKRDFEEVTAAGAKKNRHQWEPVLEMSSSGNAALIGYKEKTDAKTAALINGFNAHTLEMDDGQRFAMIHLGASVISSIKAATSETEYDEENVLIGIIMGYEAACRTALAMQPSHKKLGYHTSGTCGTIGAAVGTAFALGMDKAQMKRVLTCAAGSAAGMLEMQEQCSELKPYNLGRAAMDGLAAAYMGLAAFGTPDDMLGGDRGFFKLFSSKYDAAKLTEETDYFEIERIYVKPYASCRHSHSAVEAAIQLHDGLTCGNIESVLVETYKLGVRGHDNTVIEGTSSAKLSTPYAVAAALIYGRADLAAFDPVDRETADLAAKVRVSENEEFTRECPNKRIAAVTIFMKDGSSRTKRVDYAKGEPENPLTGNEFEKKIHDLFEYSPVE